MVSVTDSIPTVVLAVGVATGAAIDIATRRIPNTVTGGLAAAGLALAAVGLTHLTVSSALLGMAAGLALMLPGHILGATGAGDVKLFAAAGTLLGIGQILNAFAAVAIAGGVLALGIAVQRRRLGVTLTRTARLCAAPERGREEIEASQGVNAFPYGPAIAVGTILVAVV
jgi:prepilin peptidase CpaA